jgi:hypothetical protein
MEIGAAKLNELEDLFEIQPVSRYTETTDTRLELRLLKDVWDMKSLNEGTFDEWKTALWADINTDQLQEQTKRLLAAIRSIGSYNPLIKTWGTFKVRVVVACHVQCSVCPSLNRRLPTSLRRTWRRSATTWL